MANVNTSVIAGNLGKDPELRFTQGGQAVTTFGVAVERRFQRDGEWASETSWIDVVCWGNLAENVAQSCGKGTRVLVVGRYQQRSWETQTGEKRYAVELVADEVGPSLAWATAQVDRVERETASERPAPRPAPTRSYEEPF